MVVLFHMAVLLPLIAALAVACDRLKVLSRRPLAVGVLFGLAAGFATNFLAALPGEEFFLCRDAVFVAATIFFGCRVGLVAAGVAVAVAWAFPPPIPGISPFCPLGSVAAALYVAALPKYFLDGRRPSFLATLVITAFATVVHFGSEAMLPGGTSPDHTLEIARGVLLEEALQGIAVTATIALACGAARGWKRNFLSNHTLTLVFFAAAFCGTVGLRIQQNEHAIAQITQASVGHVRQRLDASLSYVKRITGGSSDSDAFRLLIPCLCNLSLGQTGYGLAVDRRTWITAEASGLDPKVLSTQLEGVLYHAHIRGQYCAYRFADCGPWRVLCVLPTIDLYWDAFTSAFLAGLVLFALCFTFRVITLRFRRSRAKIDALHAAERKRIASDLAVARTIQVSSLPTHFPDEVDYTVSALMHTAQDVGGDFYDVFTPREGVRCILAADVSGKGVHGALFMMRAKMTIRSAIFREPDLGLAITHANDRLSTNNEAGMFVTLWAALYDHSTGLVTFVNAGHPAPLVRRADGRTEWIGNRDDVQPPLGVFPGTPFAAETLSLSSGDTLLLYTDGVTEARDRTRGFYGEERLARTFAAVDPEDAVNEINEDVQRFATGTEQADDITLLALRRK